MEIEIKSQTKDLKERIDKDSEQLYLELNDKATQGKARTMHEIDVLNKRVDAVEYFRHYMMELTSEGTAVEICRDIRYIERTIDSWRDEETCMYA